MSSYGNFLSSETFNCDTLHCKNAFIAEANEANVHHSEKLNIQNPAKTGATSKVINAEAGADAANTNLGVWGATPVDLPANIAAATAASATADNTSPYGFADEAAMNAYTASINGIKDQLNLVIAALKEVGLVASS